MALQIDAVSQACNAVSRQIRDCLKQLTLHYIVHHDGQRAGALTLAAQDIAGHPAAAAARRILTAAPKGEDSALLGVAVARRNLFMGLASSDTALALCTVNIDQYESLKEARRHAWHLGWHAIDAVEQPGREESGELALRKRDGTELAAANLQADVFAAVASYLQDDFDSISRTGLMRGMGALRAKAGHAPEFYPFPVALEAVRPAADDLKKKAMSKKKCVEAALRMAGEVSQVFDDQAIGYWLAFSEPAQDMAWRGFTPEQILTAAIGISQDTHVRATAYMVSEVTGIRPLPVLEARGVYNPFADPAYSARLHEKTAREAFDEALLQGLRQHSIDPFVHMADSQNERLAEGNALGWCAAGLQAAARAFDLALRTDREPESAARAEFTGEQGKTTWDALRGLSRKVIAQCRQGRIVTLGGLAELCADVPQAASIRNSVQQTMKDPVRQQKPEAASSGLDQRPRPQARTPAPGRARRAAPVLSTAPGASARRPPAAETRTE